MITRVEVRDETGVKPLRLSATDIAAPQVDNAAAGDWVPSIWSSWQHDSFTAPGNRVPEADADIVAGRLRTFDSMEDLIADLEGSD